MPRKNAKTPEPVEITGYRVRPRYRDVTCDWYELDEGEEPFTATIRTNLTFDQLNAIPAGKDVTFEEVWQEIAPYVVGWNLVAENMSTGTVEPVPPPSEAGPIAFRALDSALSLWLIAQVRTAHLGGPERKKEPTPSGSTPAPSDGKS